MIDLFLCPMNPQCAECQYMLDVRPLQNGLHKAIHPHNPSCSHSGKHFIVRFPRLEVLAESQAEEAIDHRTGRPPTVNVNLDDVINGTWIEPYPSYTLGTDNGNILVNPFTTR